ncbi:MAG TPA: hypothetical protein VE965_05505 [Gammaproteobacteria bacterium]|jgi:hypothetical protein|nr:hypothetical protein [Gammaproteobacteria bacterium]
MRQTHLRPLEPKAVSETGASEHARAVEARAAGEPMVRRSEHEAARRATLKDALRWFDTD